MRKLKCSITYDIVSPESCEYGDIEEGGFIIAPGDGNTLAECIDTMYHTRTNLVGGIESTSAEYNCNCDQLTIIVNNSMEFETGCYESRYLHIKNITESSAKRLCQLINVKMY